MTTSGLFSVPAFLATYLTLGADNILFAVDHPFEANTDAVEFLKSLPISAGDIQKVSHANAEKLFGLGEWVPGEQSCAPGVEGRHGTLATRTLHGDPILRSPGPDDVPICTLQVWQKGA